MNEAIKAIESLNIEKFSALCHQRAEEAGFWDDVPLRDEQASDEHYDEACRNYIALKIMLVVSELSEAVEELRKSPTDDGRAWGMETYYPTLTVEGAGELPEWHLSAGHPIIGPAHELLGRLPADNPHWGKHKPEGVTVELLDALIRLGDLLGWATDITHGADGEITELVAEKLTYNQSRGHKHGKHC